MCHKENGPPEMLQMVGTILQLSNRVYDSERVVRVSASFSLRLPKRKDPPKSDC